MSALIPDGTRWCLFIGGCADGERHLIPDTVEYWDKVETPPPSTLLPRCGDLVATESYMTLYRYHRQVIGWHRQTLHLFVWQGVPPENILPALIGGYRRDKGQH